MVVFYPEDDNIKNSPLAAHLRGSLLVRIVSWLVVHAKNDVFFIMPNSYSDRITLLKQTTVTCETKFAQ